ncbi:hypothetical protein X943_000428 [Babesia divergens]|uniref:6-Cys domain-containing protein n=1 Tax=Babesia divergens TaxID=32595 RepID=A0AAD9G6H3_BABDI|nr:hypothetical protein X943_000428 [Babesia divergens]
MKYIAAGRLFVSLFIRSIWISRSHGTIAPELRGGVYKTLQTKGNGGHQITSFVKRFSVEKPVYDVVELDLNRGESITISCPTPKGGPTLFPSRLTAYYRSPPHGVGRLNMRHYSENDLLNELLMEGDEVLGLLENVSDALIMIPYGEYSRRLSFLWKGRDVKEVSTLYFVCLKEYLTPNTFEPSALIVVRVISDNSYIRDHVIDMTYVDYVPRNHDMIYTKEYSPNDDLTVTCKSKEGSDTQEAWRLLDLHMLPHNLLSKEGDDGLVLNERWMEHLILTAVEINLDHMDKGIIKVTSRDLSSMIYMYEWAFYISCTNASSQSNKIFRIVPNTVSTLDLLKPHAKQPQNEESATLPENVSLFEYKVSQGKAVALFCPSKTHTLEPKSLMLGTDETFKKEIHLNLPNTKISNRGNSLVVIDFSNTSALNNVRFQIRCWSRDKTFTSYVFALTNRMACIFDDNMDFWRPCKAVLFPSEELSIRCPRKSEKTQYGLMPEDIREGYVRVDDDYVKDRHSALSRSISQEPTGEVHKITFIGHENRALIRDEIHYECADKDRVNYTTSENMPIVIIKLVGKFEKVNEEGHLFIYPADLLTPSAPPKLFYVLLSPGTTRTIRCADFFVDVENLSMYPREDMEVFDDIPRFFSGLMLSKVKGKPVYSTRAIHGLDITKSPPRRPTSVILSLTDDYELTSRSDEAMYFVCARKDVWDDEHTDVAVIQVYVPTNTTDLYGASVERGLFRLDDDSNTGTHDDATFNILEHNVIAMHCPKGPYDINLPKCIDMATEEDDAEEEYDNEVPAILGQKEPGAFRSLWFISTDTLKKPHLDPTVNVACHCLSESGTIMATVRLISHSGHVSFRIKYGILAIVIAVLNAY